MSRIVNTGVDNVLDGAGALAELTKDWDAPGVEQLVGGFVGMKGGLGEADGNRSDGGDRGDMLASSETSCRARFLGDSP